jgi:hypothetical protein
VWFQNEFDKTPHKMRIGFEPKGEATRHRIESIKTKNNWKTYRFNVANDSGVLTCRTTDPKDMPEGHYLVRLWVEDFDIDKKPITLRLKKDVGEIIVMITPEKRKVHAQDRFTNACDGMISKLLTDSGNIDSLPAAEWLKNEDSRPQRRACLFNLLAVLKTSPEKHDPTPLLTYMKKIFLVLSDRVYVEANPKLKDRLDQLVSTMNFYTDHEPKDPVHQNVFKFHEKELNPKDYHLYSYRQSGSPSMQICIGIPNIPDKKEFPCVADLDLDLGNPLQDVVGFIVHISELFSSNKTDHIEIHDSLNVDPTKDFLYYDT